MSIFPLGKTFSSDVRFKADVLFLFYKLGLNHNQSAMTFNMYVNTRLRPISLFPIAKRHGASDRSSLALNNLFTQKIWAALEARAKQINSRGKMPRKRGRRGKRKTQRGKGMRRGGEEMSSDGECGAGVILTQAMVPSYPVKLLCTVPETSITNLSFPRRSPKIPLHDQK